MFRVIISQLHENRGYYTLPDNWMVLIKPDQYVNRPIKYLEIGAHCGVNILCVAKTFAAHPDSEIHAIDPWEDYEEYPENREWNTKNYELYLKNLEIFPDVKQKVKTYKGYSHIIVPTFQENYFDIIYVDGNHQPEFVLEDGVLAFRKLKKDGLMIFDDYNFGGLDVTKRGVDAFLTAYRDRIQYIGYYGGQIFIQKK